MHSKPAITIDTAAALMGVSKRTLWRYLRDGKLSQPGSGQRAAGRTMILIEEVADKFFVKLMPGDGDPDTDDYALLALADQGDSDAQNDLALLFLEQQLYDFALHYFHLAIAQDHADAMHYLSDMYEKGTGVEQCSETALIWRAKAAAFGHEIARRKVLGAPS